MGKQNAGVRDGTGSFLGSWQDENREVGRRQEAGEECPEEKSAQDFLDDEESKEDSNALKPEEHTICKYI